MSESAQQTSNNTDGMAVYIRLLRLALPYKLIFLLGVFAMVVNSAADVAFAALMEPFMNDGLVGKRTYTIIYIPLAIIGIFVLRGISSYFASVCVAWVGRKVVATLRIMMFNHLVYMPNKFYDHESSGELLSRLTYNTEQVAGAATHAVKVIISDGIKVIALLGLMFYHSFYLSLGFVVVAPIVSAFIALMSKRLRNISRTIQRSMEKISHVAEEAIEAHRVVKAFGGQEYEKSQYEKAVNHNRVQGMKLVSTDELFVPIIQFLMALVLASAAYVALSGVLPEVDVGVFSVFVVSMSVIMPAVKRLTSVNSTLQRGIAAGQVIFDFLDQSTEPDDGDICMERCSGKIEYRDVRFRYENSHSDVLKGISISVEPGKMVAFVGKSGSGKSTLVSLLPRFYEKQQGDIFIDGQPINEIQRKSLREQIAYVGQQVTLFNDTIAHNIAYGSLETASEQDIIDAAKRAHAWEFIEKLPDGLQTQVGEDGVLLSGGQRQRLAIARALLKDAPILILDEATSSLDTESEKQIQAGLEALMVGRTTLVIAHRLSTIEKADTIFVMNEGKIVETGEHAELLKQGGIYSALYQMQFDQD